MHEIMSLYQNESSRISREVHNLHYITYLCIILYFSFFLQIHMAYNVNSVQFLSIVRLTMCAADTLLFLYIYICTQHKDSLEAPAPPRPLLVHQTTKSTKKHTLKIFRTVFIDMKNCIVTCPLLIYIVHILPLASMSASVIVHNMLIHFIFLCAQ